ncbi:MAG TPA: folylpolyglutamate synthase/dihydrofolate synthase family protein [Longimicrobiales bacterium]
MTEAGELTYSELVRELFPRLTGGIRWGLERTQALLASVGNPHQTYRSIHIAGTNGKGSVAASLASILGTTTDAVGLYTSPHLCSFRERVQVDGSAIDEAALVSAAKKLWPEIRRVEPSFFEATTAIGLLAFAEAGVKTAVIEVGLGGRLDSTNVITPDLSVITNIAMDHAEYLGNTIEAIAAEKAGIIKPGVPVVTADTDAAVLALFGARAAEQASPLHVLSPAEVRDVTFDLDGTDFSTTWRGSERRFHTPLVGKHQAVNAGVAIRALELLYEDLDIDPVLAGLRRVDWPGRMQVERIGGQTWVFDVAHNVAGVHALVDCVHALPLPKPIVLALGILGDKDWRAMLPPLFAVADQTILTIPPTAPPNRSWDPEHALRFADADVARVVADFPGALELAHMEAAQGTVLVTGSFHTVGDALICLNRTPFGSDVTLPRVSFAG